MELLWSQKLSSGYSPTPEKALIQRQYVSEHNCSLIMLTRVNSRGRNYCLYTLHCMR